MRIALALVLILTAQSAAAHVGHFGDLAGHDHWVAGAALGVAILLGLREALKGRKEDDAPAEEAEAEEGEEAAA